MPDLSPLAWAGLWYAAGLVCNLALIHSTLRRGEPFDRGSLTVAAAFAVFGPMAVAAGLIA